MNHDPISIAKTVLWEKFGDFPNAISYCERKAAERGDLSPAYAGAALALKERNAGVLTDKSPVCHLCGGTGEVSYGRTLIRCPACMKQGTRL